MTVENRWYPHLDYAGERMAEGQFRDPQPTDERETQLRNAAIFAIERFCEGLSIAVPPLREEITLKGVNILMTVFIGEHEGQQFGIGYEVRHDS